MNTDGAFCDQAQDFPVGLPGGFTYPQLQSKGKWGGQKTDLFIIICALASQKLQILGS